MVATADPGQSRPDQLTHSQQRQLRRRECTPDGRPLKPGQRNPTPEEADEAIRANCRYRGAGFPSGRRWRIDRDRAGRWSEHNFEGRRGDTNHFRALADLSNDEFALFLWDLDCHRDLCRKAALDLIPKPLPLHEYLLEGREDWGWIGWFVEQWRAVERGEACALETDEEEDDGG